jgi:hypothetical protein
LAGRRGSALHGTGCGKCGGHCRADPRNAADAAARERAPTAVPLAHGLLRNRAGLGPCGYHACFRRCCRCEDMPFNLVAVSTVDTCDSRLPDGCCSCLAACASLSFMDQIKSGTHHHIRGLPCSLLSAIETCCSPALHMGSCAMLLQNSDTENISLSVSRFRRGAPGRPGRRRGRRLG